jgi:hypothetical protein
MQRRSRCAHGCKSVLKEGKYHMVSLELETDSKKLRKLAEIVIAAVPPAKK